MKNEFEKFIDKISYDKEKNKKLVNKYLKNYDLSYLLTKSIDNTYISIAVENKILLVVESLLECGADPNYNCFSFLQLNFLQKAFEFNYSEEFLIKLTKIAIKYNINLNNYGFESSSKSLPLGHLLISEISHQKRILPIYNLLVENGYDIFLTDENYKTLEDKANMYKDKFEDYEEFIEKYNKDREEKFENRVNEIINEIITKHPNLDYKHNESNLQYELIGERYDEDIIFELIKYLLEKGMDPNTLCNDTEETFLHIMTRKKHSNKFIKKVIDISLKHGFNPNSEDWFDNTVLHSLIIYNNEIEIIPIYLKFKKYGFDLNKENSSLKKIIDLLGDNNDITIIKLLGDNGKTDKIIDKYDFINKYGKDFEYCNNDYINNIIWLNKFGIVIENDNNIDTRFFVNNFSSNLSQKELSNENSCIAIISKIGGGKTNALNYFAYYWYKENNRKVFVTSIENIIKNSNTIGQTKEILLEIIDKCIKHEMVLCIDDLDKLYESNLSYYQKYELDMIFKYHVECADLSLIFTINKINQNIITDGLLEDCTSIANINDLNEQDLKEYINKIFVYSEFNIDNDNKVLNLLFELCGILTNETNLVHPDLNSNIKIIRDIINDIYKSYYMHDNSDFELNDLIYSIRINQDIKEEVKKIVIEELNNTYGYKEINVETIKKKLTMK